MTRLMVVVEFDFTAPVSSSRVLPATVSMCLQSTIKEILRGLMFPNWEGFRKISKTRSGLIGQGARSVECNAYRLTV